MAKIYVRNKGKEKEIKKEIMRYLIACHLSASKTYQIPNLAL